MLKNKILINFFIFIISSSEKHNIFNNYNIKNNCLKLYINLIDITKHIISILFMYYLIKILRPLSGFIIYNYIFILYYSYHWLSSFYSILC